MDDTEIIGDIGEQPKAVVEPDQTVETTPEVEVTTVEEAKPMYKRKTGKIRKKEGLALAARNKKLSTWLRDETRVRKEERTEIQSRRLDDEVIEDMDWPGIDQGGQV